MNRGPEPDKTSWNSLWTFSRCEHGRSPTEERIFFFCARNRRKRQSVTSVGDRRKVQKMTTKGASHERAESEAGSQRQEQSSSTKHTAEREHPAGCQRASQTTGPFFVETEVLSSMSFVMTPHAVSRTTDMEETSKSNNLHL